MVTRTATGHNPVCPGYRRPPASWCCIQKCGRCGEHVTDWPRDAEPVDGLAPPAPKYDDRLGYLDGDPYLRAVDLPEPEPVELLIEEMAGYVLVPGTFSAGCMVCGFLADGADAFQQVIEHQCSGRR